MITIKSLVAFALCLLTTLNIYSQSIPLPEHPRPDFERESWLNLNGHWQFEFDSPDQGISEEWFLGQKDFSKNILVPFPWGSNLSGQKDEADIAWYRRDIEIPADWNGKRIFLIIGASDWETTVWLDGKWVGKHQGGYVPFEFELTSLVKPGTAQTLVVRVDDARRSFTLYGKQGYGNARGIWQTVYLEARPKEFLDAVHFTPDIDGSQVKLTAYLGEPATRDLFLGVTILSESGTIVAEDTVKKGQHKLDLFINIPEQRLWTLDDPFLYEAETRLGDDLVHSYFGMRKISVVNLPGTDYPYIALNDEPVYLQLALDQSYHPDGFYTFPSDDFMREEIERSKSIGLNGIRPHIKVEIPRKLYWADKLGLLVMQDLPNSWGEPDEFMKDEAEYTLREMIKRDFNHPSIFSWILFNETWGLRTRVERDGNSRNVYLPETQNWVASMYYLTKSLDPTRLVEDNSICCGAGHTETDIASFHYYLAGWEWDQKVKEVTEEQRYHDGLPSLFEEGFTFEGQPIINSECGNVWGYEGSTGDVDWSFEYHQMINTFRKYPKMAGWLYTEHHDVINEWNGYWRFDRSEKYTGMEEIFEGMRLNDLHSEIYLTTGPDIFIAAHSGEKISIPLFLSSFSGKNQGDHLTLEYILEFTNQAGEISRIREDQRTISYKPWIQSDLAPLEIEMPEQPGLALLKLLLRNNQGEVLHRNFMHLLFESGSELPGKTLLSQAPDEASGSEWSDKEWQVLDGRKVNGAGSGYFEYTFDLPERLRQQSRKEVFFIVELSAKELFAKDTLTDAGRDLNFMLGERTSPSSNPNSYPMTDEIKFPSRIEVTANGQSIRELVLPDDPADHRGVLSWHAQLKDRKLREAGSYGYLVKVPLPDSILREAANSGKLIIRVQTKDNGGIAVYGKSFGRYPFDPSVIFVHD